MNNKGSKIQKLMWAISGNESWIIENCPTNYKYYSRQGLLFIMTFFFAAFCGAFAGNEFGGSWVTTIIFGLIWGLLVYSIDQVMVQTIDKVYVDTITTAAKFGKYFFPRIFLGCLLALFMSSPLDHYLFREQITDQMQKNADEAWMAYQKELEATMDIEGTQDRLKGNQSNRDSLIIAKGKNPNTITFQEAKQNYDREKPILSQLSKSRDDKRLEMNLAWSKIPERYDTLTHKTVKIRNTSEYGVYLRKNNEYTTAKTAYESKVKEIERYETTMIEERRKYEEELTAKIQRQDTIIDKLDMKIEEDNATVEQKTKDKRDFLNSLQGFDTKFMTLLTHPNFGVQFLRWFIFLVFLLIEILPTWMKLMGKPREYDKKLDLIRKKRITEFESVVEQDEKIAEIKKDSEIQLADDKEKQRRIKELDNHQQMLDKISIKYDNITSSILDDWETKINSKNN
jgi:hypothetical protein